MEWEKRGRHKRTDGTMVNVYISADGKYMIESRKVEKPHANRAGTWTYPEYVLITPEAYEYKKMRLSDAKEFAEYLETH